MPTRNDNLKALLAKLRDESLAWRLVSLLRDTAVERWDEVLADCMSDELKLEVQRLTTDAETQPVQN